MRSHFDGKFLIGFTPGVDKPIIYNVFNFQIGDTYKGYSPGEEAKQEIIAGFIYTNL
jgi:hypothetical protein